MEERLHTYIARKLRNAVDAARSGGSPHEGAYRAYQEILQWLEDLEHLPSSVRRVLERYRDVADLLPTEVRALHARQKVASMSEADVCVLLEALEAAAQAMFTKPAAAAAESGAA